MKNMRLKELEEKLRSNEFQNTENDIFYNFFIYLYDPADEYKMRAQIREFKQNLLRPVDYVDVLTIDIFEELCNFLNNQPYGNFNSSLLQYLLEKDKDAHEAVLRLLTGKANCSEFYKYLDKHIKEHISISDDKKRPYVFLYGLGKIFPYMRISALLANYEQYNKSSRYKIIVFYPGNKEGNNYRLFNILEDHHTYRATLMNG